MRSTPKASCRHWLQLFLLVVDSVAGDLHSCFMRSACAV